MAGDVGWEQRLEEMIRVAELRSINKKITAVTKGRHESSLNKIEVTQHEWYFSKLTQDLLRHDDRKFVALLSAGKNKFHSHHSQKVYPAILNKWQ